MQHWKHSVSRCFFGFGLAVAFASASASITSYSFGKGSYSVQTSDAQPVADYYAARAIMFTDTPFDLLAGTITLPDGITQRSANFSPDQYLIWDSEVFSSLEDLDLAYPPGNYLYEVTAGPAAPASAILALGPSDFPDDVPYLTGGTWSSLQLCPSNTDAPITCNTFSHPGTAAIQVTNFDVIDYTAVANAFSDAGPGSTFSSTTIPGTALRSGHAYAYVVTFYSYDEFPSAGFDNATATTTFVRNTTGYFKVKADPGTISGRILFEDYYPDPVFQPVVVEVLDGSGNVLDSQTITMGYFGYYAFDTAVTGVRSIRFKGTNWLSTLATGVDIDTGQDALDVSLRNGDIDGNNMIDSDDFDILVANFGLAGAGSDGNLNGYLDIDSDDFDILVKNFGLIGD